MSSIQERLQLKREPLDKWSVREQLCLASAVARSGDQNWMSVSRALKPFGDPNRPSDWFHQKNCAAQYGALLSNVETPKRKKRSGTDTGLETPAESILRKLLSERQAELKRLLVEERTEYLKLQEDLAVLHAGKVSEEQLDKWCKEIDEEEARKEQESITHAQWLKEREIRKQEIEKAWRPTKPMTPGQNQKRKSSESLDNSIDIDNSEEQPIQQSENPKPALSPLLTSLLKSPSHVQNVATSSILHSVITNQRSLNTSSVIANLLNSSASVTVSPSLQQLVTTAIGNEQQLPVDDHSQPIGNDILDDPNLPNLKIDDLASSILVQDGPLPEIKKEEVDDIISEIIENAHDIVTDPEQHLQLDGNGDININLGLDDFEDEETDIVENTVKEEEQKDVSKNDVKIAEKTVAVMDVDPFEFQEDPVIFTPSNNKVESKQIAPFQHTSATTSSDPETLDKSNETNSDDPLIKLEKDSIDDPPQLQKIDDIVEGDNLRETENLKNSDKSEELDTPPEITQEQENVDLIKPEIDDKINIEVSTPESKDTIITEDSSENSELDNKVTADIKKPTINLDVPETTKTTITPDFVEELYDDMTMEVKVDKTGKMKRDYSRTKKKEDKGFDVLLSIEKSNLDDEPTDETLSDKELLDVVKKDMKNKLKTENDRSNSPWTEEEDFSNTRSKRRYSTPATPSDSVPNSPASSVVFYDDDRDYRNWKKSVMLVYNRLASNKYASLFLKPITEDQAPGYKKIVYRPTDLHTIKKNIENGVIRSSAEFKRDVMLMFTNAMMYNKSHDTIYNMALQMQQESMQPIEILMQAQSNVDVSFKRETRTSESGSKRKRTITNSEDNAKNKKRKED